MPNARKKKAAKMEDFKKKRLKVGKKKATPDNFTDTSFKSKSISLPNQSINEDKSHEVTTSRNLTLTDLVTQLKHYNSRVKKEALAGLTDLCNTHPDILIASLGSVVNGLLKLFISEDREVRKATLSFLKETFPEIDRVELQPFMPLLVIYTCSAMTHIFEDVRLDAVKLMDLWIQIAPDVIVTKFWSRVIGNYMSLLAVDSNKISAAGSETSGIKGVATTSNVKAAATKSHLHIHKNKLGLFSSLSKFLGTGLADEQSHSEFWFLLNYLENRHAKQAFKEKMANYESVDTSKTAIWDVKHKNAYIVPHNRVASIATYLSEGSKLATFSHLNLFESSGPKTNTTTTTSNTMSDVNTSEFSKEDRLRNIKELIETFQPIFIASWLEAAPSVFISTSTISMTPALELLHEILHLSLILWRSMVESNTISTLPKKWLHNHLQTLLRHLTVYFPYGADSFGNRGSKVDDMLQEMNIMLCELTSLYLLARTMQRNNTDNSKKLSERQQAKRRKIELEEEQEDVLPEWAEIVVGHVLGALGVDANGNTVPTSSSFRAENLISLLPAIWGLLNCLDYDESTAMFKATLQYYKICQPNSPSKRVLLDFITRVYMVQSTPSYNGQFHIEKESELAQILQDWASDLPENFLTKRMALAGNL